MSKNSQKAGKGIRYRRSNSFFVQIIILLIFIIGAISSYIGYRETSNSGGNAKNITREPQAKISLRNLVSDLDLDGNTEEISFRSPAVNLTGGTTDILVNGQNMFKTSLKGYFYKSNIYNLNQDIRILEIQTNSGGKLINSLIYKYEKEQLIRIPVSTEKPPYLAGTESSGGTEFKDINHDNVLEMFVYHRLYPPQAKRRVEVYKFDGQALQKYTEYEEPTPSTYY